MIETELLALVASNGWAILQTKELGQEGDYTSKAIAVCKVQDSVLDRKWLKYYLKTDGTCYWQENNPFSVAIPDTSFRKQVQNKITSLVTAATIKAGYIEKLDEVSETALVVVIKSDNSLTMYHVCKVGGVLTITSITGTYPI